MERFGLIEAPMGPMGPIWAHMGPYGANRGPYGAHMSPYGPIWAHMGPYGAIWAHKGLYFGQILKFLIKIMWFLSFSNKNDAESLCHFVKIPFLDPKRAKLDQNSDFRHVRTYSWLHKLRNTQGKMYGTYLRNIYIYIYGIYVCIYIYIYISK